MRLPSTLSASVPVSGTEVPGSVVDGIGLHTGRSFRVSVHVEDSRSVPDKSPDSSIRFEHAQNGFLCEAPALWTRLSATSRSTSLVLRGPSKARVELKTVEHFLAAVHAAGFPKLRVDVESLSEMTEGASLEMPALDGSAAGWISALRPFVNTAEVRCVWVPTRSFDLCDGDKQVVVSPPEDPSCPRTEYLCSVDFGRGLLQDKRFVFDWARPEETFEGFAREIAPARTFGFKHELESLAARKLARGGSLENAVLIDGSRVVNPGGFRVESELAAHKLLDAVGDFALLGAPIVGRVFVHKAGHSMHLRCLEEAVRTGAIARARLLKGRTLIR